MIFGVRYLKVSALPADLDRAAIHTAANGFNARDRAPFEKVEHAFPLIRRTVSKTEYIEIFAGVRTWPCEFANVRRRPAVGFLYSGVKSPHAAVSSGDGNLAHREPRFVD
jgi:hypothetical protein